MKVPCRNLVWPRTKEVRGGVSILRQLATPLFYHCHLGEDMQL